MQWLYVALFDTIFIGGTCSSKFKLFSGKLCDFDTFLSSFQCMQRTFLQLAPVM